jgi:2-polyprenyl-6-methoxyphenol hydroxylase-like FAD-dependent oxidoreductase
MLDIVGNQLIYASEHGSAVACTPAEWLVGAEGNASPIRRSLGIPSQLTCLSHMAGSCWRAPNCLQGTTATF